MSNQDYPCGLTPFSPDGRTPRQQIYYAGTTTSIFRGDVVAINSSGRVHTIATTAGSIYTLGVAANYVDATVAPGSTTAQKVWVYDDPQQLFVIQDDGDSATPARTDVGAQCPLILTTGSTTTGQSKQELNVSGVTTSLTEVVKIIGFKEGPTFEIGKNAKYIVKLNRHFEGQARVGI
jgi:hypothetical protein